MYKDLGSVASVTEGWHNHNCIIALLGRLRQRLTMSLWPAWASIVKFRAAWARIRACLKHNKTMTAVIMIYKE